MNRYIAATLSIAAAIGPASALDVGLGGQVGGIGVGAGLDVGKEGAAVGAGTSVDGVGGANVGGSVDTSKGSLDAGVGASGNLGGANGGLSAGVGVGGKSSGGDGAGAAPGDTSAGSGSTGSAGTGAAARGSSGSTGAGSTSTGRSAEAGMGAAPGGGSTAGSAGRGDAGTTTVIGPANGVRQAIALPRNLLPSKTGHDKFARNAWGYPLLTPFKAIPGTPLAVVRVCRQAIASAATSLGAVRVHAASAGPPSRQRRGALAAPLQVRIYYARQGGIEVRQARISCRLDAAGRVIAVT